MDALDQNRLARLDRQNSALLDISRRWRLYEANLDTAAAAIVETATAALDIDRASVWLYNATRDAIVCHDLYEAGKRQHSRGTVLYARDVPAYFEALQHEEVIAAHDAHTDPRTAAFSKTYLAPCGIGAMLDAPIRFGGRAVGVICHEHVGGPRHFTTDEQNTASYLGYLMSLAYEFQRRTESELEIARAFSLLRAAFEASGAGVVAIDASGRVSAFNQRFLDLWGMPEELLGPAGDLGPRTAHIAALAKDPEAIAARAAEVIGDPESESLDVFELKDGRTIECTSQPQRLDGHVIGRVWSFRDVSHQRRIEEELRELAVRDVLTGLFNRRRAQEMLEKEIRRSRRGGQPLSVALLDIDHFKTINDVHGHRVGDDVLRVAAAEIGQRLRGTDTACRWGGDEMLLILPGTDRAGAGVVVDAIRRHVARERTEPLTFTVSAGVAQYADGNYDALIASADVRLYEAKQRGRNCVV